jgi:tryptophan-rich sensory protein
MTSATKRAAALAGWVALCLLVAALGSLATTPEIPGWYAQLAKPTWTPPSWVFGPVWTTLYVLMGVAAWLVWRRGGFRSQARPLTLFLTQLALNLAWSFVFFGAHQVGWALVDILLLWVAIAATALAFSRASRPAAWLLAPYLAWVSYAAALNASIWLLNR